MHLGSIRFILTSYLGVLAGTIFALTKLLMAKESQMSRLVVVKFIVLETLPRGCSIVWSLISDPKQDQGGRN